MTVNTQVLRQKLESSKDTNLVILNVENPVLAESSSFSADAKLTDDDDAPQHKCTRCNRVKKEVSHWLECSRASDYAHMC